MHGSRKNLWFLLAIALLAGGCKKDEENPTPTDDNEAITTITLTSQTTLVQTVTAVVENSNTTADLSRATLKANTTYTGTINLLYKTKSAHAGRIGRSETGRQ